MGTATGATTVCYYTFPNLAYFHGLQYLQIPIQTQLIHLQSEVVMN